MKKNILVISLLSLLVIVLTTPACKKFLNVEPVYAMSGNNFWKSKTDVEQFTLSIYNDLRNATCMDYYTLLGLADLRNTAWKSSVSVSTDASVSYIQYLNNNDIANFRNFSANYPRFGATQLTNWSALYKVIAGANTLLYNIENKNINGFSTEDKDVYHAEGVFIRGLVYFLMVRHWGDVPYETDVNDKTPKPRMNQVQVLKNCIADLKANLGNLPWSYQDRSFKGTRAMKGGALALMMEMYMWMACFDAANEIAYYTEVEQLGNMLIDQNQGNYSLVTFESYKELFKGGTTENLFEIGQDYNYKETFGVYASIAALVLRTPYKRDANVSSLYYDPVFLYQLYGTEYNGATDKRRDTWFEPAYMYPDRSALGQFVFLKFINMYTTTGGIDLSNDNKILFRLADAYLLRAEARQKLGRFDEAIQDLNTIRQRAGAEVFIASGTGIVDTESGGSISLSDAIWWERERELMGEGRMFYDLVRTKRILSTLYTPNTMLYDDFIKGAWTYPINPAVIQKNPLITPNSYWTN